MKKIGTIGHVDHGKTSLTAAIVRLLAMGVDIRSGAERGEYRCPVCKSGDRTAYQRCEHPGCPDGRDPR